MTAAAEAAPERTTPLRVGIIGASAAGGWARESHVPAVQALEGLELVAVATNSQATADAAAQAFGASGAYGDAGDLLQDPSIDIVTVAAPVPVHRELILGALRAGKHVYSEWPLGSGTGEAAEIAGAAREAGLHTAIGLQSLMNPVVAEARRLLDSGALGRLLTASAHSTTAGFGPRLGESELYLEDPASAMNLATIQMAHTVDFVIRLFGALTSLSALLTTQYPDLEVGDPPVRHHRSTADHVLLHGRAAAGGAVSIEVAGGRPANDTPFRLEIVGEEGTLGVRGGAARGFQSGRLELFLDGQRQELDSGQIYGLADPVVNVAGVYAALRDDIVTGTRAAPDFEHAHRLARLVDAAFASDLRGERVEHSDWPTADGSIG